MNIDKKSLTIVGRYGQVVCEFAASLRCFEKIYYHNDNKENLNFKYHTESYGCKDGVQNV